MRARIQTRAITVVILYKFIDDSRRDQYFWLVHRAWQRWIQYIFAQVIASSMFFCFLEPMPGTVKPVALPRSKHVPVRLASVPKKYNDHFCFKSTRILPSGCTKLLPNEFVVPSTCRSRDVACSCEHEIVSEMCAGDDLRLFSKGCS